MQYISVTTAPSFGIIQLNSRFTGQCMKVILVFDSFLNEQNERICTYLTLLKKNHNITTSINL